MAQPCFIWGQVKYILSHNIYYVKLLIGLVWAHWQRINSSPNSLKYWLNLLARIFVEVIS